MIRHEQSGTVTVYPPDGDAFEAHVRGPETPGAYCFAPVAACITGAARLMLALLECSVTDAGDSWVFCDTDTDTDTGSDLIACPDGPHQLPKSSAAVKALTRTTSV